MIKGKLSCSSFNKSLDGIDLTNRQINPFISLSDSFEAMISQAIASRHDKYISGTE